jgi:hypothetical protein
MSNRPASIALLASAAIAAVLATAPEAHADENRRGLQLEGMIGGSGCLPGRTPCRQDQAVLSGGTKPSFGVGAALGARPFRWLLIGGMYRWGMFNPDYRTDTDAYTWGGQHTIAALIRPIIPIWRFDLGLNIAPGFGRQVYRRETGRDRDYSQGFAFLTGPTVDVFLTDRFFLGAEVDFIFNTQKKVCEVRDGDKTCFQVGDRPTLAPTHQVLFGLHLGGTFL